LTDLIKLSRSFLHLISLADCTEWDYKCASGFSCIPRYYLCDNYQDCPDNDDEANCNGKVKRSQAKRRHALSFQARAAVRFRQNAATDSSVKNAAGNNCESYNVHIKAELAANNPLRPDLQDFKTNGSTVYSFLLKRNATGV